MIKLSFYKITDRTCKIEKKNELEDKKKDEGEIIN